MRSKAGHFQRGLQTLSGFSIRINSSTLSPTGHSGTRKRDFECRARFGEHREFMSG